MKMHIIHRSGYYDKYLSVHITYYIFIYLTYLFSVLQMKKTQTCLVYLYYNIDTPPMIKLLYILYRYKNTYYSGYTLFVIIFFL